MSEPVQESPNFTESLRAPGWMFAFLGLMLGVTSGVLTAVGIRSLGDDPLVSGPEALIFYLSFAIAILGTMYVMLGSTLMQTTATPEGVTVGLGIFGTHRTFRWADITAIRATDHNIARHGGRGNPFAPSSRKSWTMYGIRSGVELEIAVGDGNQIVFVSSLRGDELVKIGGAYSQA